MGLGLVGWVVGDEGDGDVVIGVFCHQGQLIRMMTANIDPEPSHCLSRVAHLVTERAGIS